jgi:hypothetical protein
MTRAITKKDMFIVLMVLLVFLNVADLVFTLPVISSELNPILPKTPPAMTVVKAMLLFCSLVLLACVYLQRPRTVLAVMAFLNLVYFALYCYHLAGMMA